MLFIRWASQGEVSWHNVTHHWLFFFFFFLSDKTQNLLFNGAKAVMDKIGTGEETCPDSQPSGHLSACSQTLLRGQTLIGHDGRLTRTSAAQQGLTELSQGKYTVSLINKEMHSENLLSLTSLKIFCRLWSFFFFQQFFKNGHQFPKFN